MWKISRNVLNKLQPTRRHIPATICAHDRGFLSKIGVLEPPADLTQSHVVRSVARRAVPVRHESKLRDSFRMSIISRLDRPFMAIFPRIHLAGAHDLLILAEWIDFAEGDCNRAGNHASRVQ
jgi:hypothetical protein